MSKVLEEKVNEQALTNIRTELMSFLNDDWAEEMPLPEKLKLMEKIRKLSSIKDFSDIALAQHISYEDFLVLIADATSKLDLLGYVPNKDLDDLHSKVRIWLAFHKLDPEGLAHPSEFFDPLLEEEEEEDD